MARTKKADSALPAYNGQDVIGAAVKLGGAGTGLSAALAVDPVQYAIGDTLFVVLEVEVSGHEHVPVKDTNCLSLVHKLKAQTATFVDGDLVADHLEKQRIRIEEARGVHRLPLPDGENPTDDEWESG